MGMMKHRILLLFTGLLLNGALRAEEAFTFKGGAEKWGGERISLPTGFAPDMQVKGIEEIRFAPGMFNPDADDFFSYVFVFACPEDTWTEAVIHREILTYYRGLSKSVSRGKVTEAKAGAFTFKLEATKVEDMPADAEASRAYAGVLQWIEPFKTLEPQTLHMEIATWKRAGVKRHYLFAGVSPRERAHALWKDLRKIRSSLVVK